MPQVRRPQKHRAARPKAGTPPLIYASDYAATDRIVAAVGLEPTERRALHDDLVVAIGRLSGQKRTGTKEAWRAYHRGAKSIARAADALLHVLKAEEQSEVGVAIAAALIPERQVPADRPIDEVKDRLRRLAHVAAEQAEATRVPPKQDSALRHLVRDDLSAIYRRHFRRKPGRSRPARGGRVDGPYVRFVIAVLAEIAETVSPNTIDSYLK